MGDFGIGFLLFGPNTYEMSIQQAKSMQHSCADLKLLTDAGPGHQVVRATWLDRNGWVMSEAEIFPSGADTEIAEWKKAIGYPGHSGSRWNYFKADVRAWLNRHLQAAE